MTNKKDKEIMEEITMVLDKYRYSKMSNAYLAGHIYGYIELLLKESD